MSADTEIQRELKATEELLQDIESELYFRMPNSTKLADIRNMVNWLKGGEPIATSTFPTNTWPTTALPTTEPEFDWPETLSDPFELATDTHIDLDDPFENPFENASDKENKKCIDHKIPKGSDVWHDPTACILNQLDTTAAILLNLNNKHGTEVLYQPRICEMGKPFYFMIDKTTCQDVFEGFIILLAHYARYNEIFSWQDIQDNSAQTLIHDVLLHTLANHQLTHVSTLTVSKEIDWQNEVALFDILQQSENENYGVMCNGVKLNINKDYQPQLLPLNRDALCLQMENDNPTFFFETQTHYVWFGS